MAPVLETVGLEKHFGGLTAVAGLSLKIEKGARHALIGPNGAGKTTVINLLTGVLRPSSGRILLEGADITSLESYRRVRRGLARTFQINQLFPDLTPLETIGLVLVLIVLVGRDRFGSWTGGVRALAAGMLRRFTGGSAPVPVPPGKGR